MTSEAALYQHFVRNYEEAGEIMDPATKFRGLLTQHGAVETARLLIERGFSLLADGNLPGGLMRLKQIGRLDLSVEATVVDNDKYHKLFDEHVIEQARITLRELEYLEKP